MNENAAGIGAPKVHPASRPVEPDDPLELQATSVPGEPLWMLQVLVEEYCQMGWTPAEIVRLADDPFYQAFYGLKHLLGAERFRDAVAAVVNRHGVFHVTARERNSTPPIEFVDLQLPVQPKATAAPQTPEHSP